MRGRLRVIARGAVVAALLAAAPAVAEAEPARTDKAQFEARYAALKDAMRAHDGPRIAAQLAPGFESVDLDGTALDGPAMIAAIAGLPLDPQRQTRTEILSLDVAGTRAAVTQRYLMVTYRNDPDASRHLISIVSLSDDVWTRRGGQWLLAHTATRELTILRDGVVVVHKAH